MDLNFRKNEWRKAQTAKVREERVITGYIEIKYPKIYDEAAGFYNMLNKKYPNKCDLRKTNDYHVWKTSIMGETLKQPNSRKSYPNIKKSVYVDVENSFKPQNSVKSYKDNLELKIPLMPYMTKNPELNQNPTVEPAETVICETDTTQAQLDKEIEKIMGELREDPCLGAFFSNLKLNQNPTVEPTETAELNQNPLVEPTETTVEPTETPEFG